jgi:hypothetical protein
MFTLRVSPPPSPQGKILGAHLASSIVSWKAAMQEQRWDWPLCYFVTRFLEYFPAGLGLTIIPAAFCSDSASWHPAKTHTISN